MIEVVAAVIEEGGRFLAGRRSAGRHHGGLWEFPGGKVEVGESRDEALVREIREELAVDVEPLGTVAIVERDGLRLVFMRARLLTDRPTGSTDHDRLRWYSPEQLLDVDWAPSDAVAARALTGD